KPRCLFSARDRDDAVAALTRLRNRPRPRTENGQRGLTKKRGVRPSLPGARAAVRGAVHARSRSDAAAARVPGGGVRWLGSFTAQPSLPAEGDARERPATASNAQRDQATMRKTASGAEASRGRSHSRTHALTRRHTVFATTAVRRIPAYSSVAPTRATPTAAVAA